MRFVVKPGLVQRFRIDEDIFATGFWCRRRGDNQEPLMRLQVEIVRVGYEALNRSWIACYRINKYC